MRLLQRYILTELIRSFLFLLSVLTVLLVFVGVFREATESGLGPLQILQILPFVVPSLLPFTIPATLLLTVCVVYGRIAGDHEITAAKAAGINVLSLLWPAFLLGIVFSLCSFWLTDRVIPWAVANIQDRIAMALEDIFIDRLRSAHEVTNKAKGFSVTVMGVEGKTLIRPCFKFTPPGRDELTIQAQSATLDFDLRRQEVILHLHHTRTDVPGSQGWLKRHDQRFPLPYSMPPPKPRHLTTREIRQQLDELREQLQSRRYRRSIETALALALNNVERLWQQDMIDFEYYDAVDRRQAAKLNTEIHSRVALSASCFFFVLLGSPFAIIQARRQFLTSFVMCFFPILLGYYPLMLLMMNQSKAGMIDPAWAMWVPNLAVLVVAGIALRRVLKH